MSCTCGKESIRLCDECWGKYLEERIYSDAPQKQDLQSQLTLAEKKLAIAVDGLARIRTLANVGPLIGASDYEQGVASGYCDAADIQVFLVGWRP